MDSIKSNINNLTSLWKSATVPFQTYSEGEGFGYCYIKNSQWPNRIWTKQKLTIEILNSIMETINQSPEHLTFSYFDDGNTDAVELILGNGFTENFIQYGMSLKPHQLLDTSSDLNFLQVKKRDEITLWCQSFEKAFGYQIDPETVESSLNKIDYFLIDTTDGIVGTIILYQTGEVSGIHSLGVIPEKRGKGYAKSAMHLALNLFYNQGVKLVALQASEMARTMYEKLGFTTEFIMRNYSLKK